MERRIGTSPALAFFETTTKADQWFRALRGSLASRPMRRPRAATHNASHSGADLIIRKSVRAVSTAPLYLSMFTAIIAVRAVIQRCTGGGNHGKEPASKWPRAKEAEERKSKGHVIADVAL